MAKSLKGKRLIYAVEMRTFKGAKGTYLVMKIKNSYHVFVEVEAKDAARDVDSSLKKGNVKRMWDGIWKKP